MLPLTWALPVSTRAPLLSVTCTELKAGSRPCVKESVTCRGAAPTDPPTDDPVTLTATLHGRANLRTAAAPRSSGAIAGELEVQPLAVTVDRTRDGVTMSRKWSYVIFPASTGTMTIPPLTARVFDPTAGRREVRCASSTLEVQAAEADVGTGFSPSWHGLKPAPTS